MYELARLPRDLLQSRRNLGLVVVDMQVFKDPMGKSPLDYRYGSVPDGIAKLCRVIDCAKRNRIPIIIVTWATYPVDRREDEEYTKLMVPGLIAEIWAEVGGYTRMRITQKRQNSAFSNPAFQDALDELGIGRVILGGYNKEVCVWETARDLLGRGYEVITSERLFFVSRTCDWRAWSGIVDEFYRTMTVQLEPEQLMELIARERLMGGSREHARG
jgi:nicotinamidase-related amidase